MTNEYMKKEIRTNDAPKPVGPYSQGVTVGGATYLSGQIGLDPKTGEIVEGSVEDEAKQVFKNLSFVLEAAGLSVCDVVRTDLFLADMHDFVSVNALYERWLGDVAVKPARQTVEVSALPKGARLEVSCIAHKE